MKNIILKTAAILLISAGGFFCITRCHKENSPKEKICNVDNPLQDLPWLKQFIDEIKDIESGYDVPHMRIYQCTYKDGTGFLINDCVGCPDAGLNLVNCEGTSLCVLYGLAGDPCTEFEIDFESMKLIWEINR
jgi:hypothetical protein